MAMRASISENLRRDASLPASLALLQNQPIGACIYERQAGLRCSRVASAVSSLLQPDPFEQIGYLHERVRLNLFWCHLTKCRRLSQE